MSAGVDIERVPTLGMVHAKDPLRPGQVLDSPAEVGELPVQERAGQLDYSADTFDLARCVLVLLHVDDADKAIREMVRVLRPGGRLVCIDVDHQMDALDATDVELAEKVLRGRFEGLRNPRIGRQLRALLVGAGLIDVDVEALSQVSTSWADFEAVAGQHSPTMFDVAVETGVASVLEVAALEDDLRARDREGRFFACAVRMRACGTKPTGA